MEEIIFLTQVVSEYQKKRTKKNKILAGRIQARLINQRPKTKQREKTDFVLMTLRLQEKNLTKNKP